LIYSVRELPQKFNYPSPLLFVSKMANIAFNIVGIVLGNVLGIVPLLGNSNLTPDPLTAENPLVRIGIGLPSRLNDPSSSTSSNCSDSSNYRTTGGTIPSLRVYNENKELIGHSSPDYYNTISEGQFTTVTVYQNSSGSYQQSPFLQVTGGSDDICIAYLGQTWADGTKLGWLGDVGKFCGARWYYSNLFVEMRNGTMYKVRSSFLLLFSYCLPASTSPMFDSIPSTLFRRFGDADA